MDSALFEINFMVLRYVVSEISQKSQKMMQSMEV